MERRDSYFDEKTRIPVGLAVGATIFICGLVLWAGRIEWVLSATADSQKILVKDVNSYKDDVQSIKSDLLAIKCQLGVKDQACLSFPHSRK